MKTAPTVLAVVWLTGVEAVSLRRSQSSVPRETRKWWQWSELAKSHGLVDGVSAMRFANVSTAPPDLFWWQLTDGSAMKNTTTCLSFQHNMGHDEWHMPELDKEVKIVPHRVEECGQYIRDSFSAYLAASQQMGSRWSVSDLIKLNDMLRGPPEVFKSPLDGLEDHTFSTIVAKDQSVSAADEHLRDVNLVKSKVPCETLPSVHSQRWAGMMCARLDSKPRLLQQYLDEYYTSIAQLPPSSQRGEEAWDEMLIAVERLFFRMYELHPFRDGNSRTRLILLDALLCENGLHPVLGLYKIKNPSPVDESIKEALLQWEVAVETGINPWMTFSKA